MFDIPFTKRNLSRSFHENANSNNLLGLAQVLAYYGIDSKAIKIEKMEDIELEWIPCVAYYNKDFVVITKIRDGNIVLYTKQGYARVDRETFNKDWNGILLLLEVGKYSGEPFYKESKEEIKTRNTRQLLFLLILLIISILCSYLKGWGLIDLFNFIGYIVGSMLSFLILKKSIIEDYEIKPCMLKTIFDCNIHYKIFNKSEFCDLSLTFFISMSFTSLIYPIGIGTTQLFLLAVLPFILWSLNYQFLIVKKVCPICLLIIVILLVLFFANFAFRQISLKSISFSDILLMVLSFVSSFFIVMNIRNKIKDIKSYDILKINHNHLKEEYVRFIATGQKQNDENFIIENPCNEIIIGNNESKNTLIVVLNPYCVPCYTNYLQGYNLLSIADNMKFVIKFIYWDEKQYSALKYIFTAIQKRAESIEKIIFDWYYIGVKDKDAFIKKYTCNNITHEAVETIELHKQWCLNESISSSPVLFYNGYKIASGISIMDITNAL